MQESGPRTGTRFGPYELRSLLGKGGMGEVYEAYDTVKDRVVAVKLLSEELAKDPMYQLRFRRESQAAARLAEPHVIPIHDWGVIDGVLFIDMRLVRGVDLRTLLRSKGPLSPARAVGIIEQIASALDAAHANNLVHRDVKPANIMVTDADFAYLADFGIAHTEGDSAVTLVGMAVGSYIYMAPERFDVGPVTGRADVYSLACVLHECLTGATPFPAASMNVLIKSHMSDPPPRPSALAGGIPAGLDEVVHRGMAKDPADRFPTATALARAARAALASTPSGPTLVVRTPDRSQQTVAPESTGELSLPAVIHPSAPTVVRPTEFHFTPLPPSDAPEPPRAPHPPEVDLPPMRPFPDAHLYPETQAYLEAAGYPQPEPAAPPTQVYPQAPEPVAPPTQVYPQAPEPVAPGAQVHPQGYAAPAAQHPDPAYSRQPDDSTYADSDSTRVYPEPAPLADGYRQGYADAAAPQNFGSAYAPQSDESAYADPDSTRVYPEPAPPAQGYPQGYADAAAPQNFDSAYARQPDDSVSADSYSTRVYPEPAPPAQGYPQGYADYAAPQNFDPANARQPDESTYADPESTRVYAEPTVAQAYSDMPRDNSQTPGNAFGEGHPGLGNYPQDSDPAQPSGWIPPHGTSDYLPEPDSAPTRYLAPSEPDGHAARTDYPPHGDYPARTGHPLGRDEPEYGYDDYDEPGYSASRQGRSIALPIMVAVFAIVALTVGGAIAWQSFGRGQVETTSAAAHSEASAPAARPTTQAPSRTSAPSATSTSTKPSQVTLPAGAKACGQGQAATGAFTQSATGTPVTSCAFAEEVRRAYAALGQAQNATRDVPRSVVATSPVTGRTYTMNCLPEGQLVTCSGGENAVVYVY
ncbi:protein kinase domain-containing protein [Nocardia beijingensis]|uniref:serine/threonine-protein kinase n=1 Tax=Nocardia beijingensis TaxID=95162 RepID=UPI003D9F1348